MKRLILLLALVLMVGCTAAQTPKPVLSEEAALEAAKSADPRASVEGWATSKVRLAEKVDLQVDGKTEKRTVWVIEATRPTGQALTFYVDAMTAPARVLRVDGVGTVYVTREQAVAAALNGSTEAQLGNAQFIQKYNYNDPNSGARELPVWVIDLVTKGDLRPHSRVLVDAVTGKVLSVSSPRTGQ